MKLFSRICVWTLSLLVSFMLGTDAVWAQDANKESIQGFIVTFSRFLQNILLPLLFSLAFLYFIFNTAKLFIIDGASEIDRDTAKRSALYGVAAFVFLILIWALVGLFVSGLGLTRDESLCADYFSVFGGPCTEQSGDTFSGGGVGAGTGTNGDSTSGGTGSGSTGSGDGSGTGSGSSGAGTGGNGSGSTGGGTTVTTESSLAELVFGTGKDAVGFERTLNSSDTLASTPVIGTTTNCVDGFNTLRLSSDTETTQAGYVFYKNANGAWRWKNITQTHSSNYIGYDRDKFDRIVAGGQQKIYLVHTHPASRTKNLGLSMSGHGPSAADLLAMCTLNDPLFSHITVDESGVFESVHQSGACPFSSSDTTLLARVETYLALAQISVGSRASELDQFTDSDLVSPDHKSYFGAIDGTELAAMSESEVIAESRGTQGTLGITVTQFDSVNAFCSSI